MKAGDTSRLRRIPDSVLEKGEGFPETFRLFEAALGRCFTIREEHPYELIEIWVDPSGRNSESPRDDSLFIERENLELVGSEEDRLPGRERE